MEKNNNKKDVYGEHIWGDGERKKENKSEFNMFHVSMTLVLS